MEQSYHSFLMALKGKTVTIYKGGPESKKGRLLDVKPDYIAVYTQNNNNQGESKGTVVYYQVQHIKSVIEDTKSNSMQVLRELEQVEHLEADCFIGLLEHLVGKTVQINQGGPESKHGTLVGVSGDFLILYTEDDGLVYVNCHHVKSITELQQLNQQELQIPEWVIADSFKDVFAHFSHQWVSINRGGPEAMEGVLVENVGGHYTLVNNQEIMRIHPFHIQSISSGPKGHLKQNNNQENKQEEKEECKQEEKEECKQEESSESSNESSSNESSSESSSNESSSSSSNESSSSSSEKQGKKSGNSRKHHSHREKVVKTIDYNWKF